MIKLDELTSGGFLGVGMGAVGLRYWRPFQEALQHPGSVQAQLLRRILARNAETDFGRAHQFGRLDSWRAYRDSVPIAEYEQLKPMIDRQAEAGEQCLTTQAPIHYARTSGTTGAAKLLPVTQDGLAALEEGQRLFAYAQYRQVQTFAGRILAIAGAAVETRTPAGAPIGSTTGAIYAAMPRPIRRRYIVPPALFTVADYEVRDYLIALLGIADENVSALATANPSTLVRLQQVIRDRWDNLLDDLETGRPGVRYQLNSEQLEAITARLQPDPARARELRRRVSSQAEASFRDIWPDLKSIVTWTGGSCGYALGALRPNLPDGTRVIEAGYHASECSGTVNIAPRENWCVPALRATVFEFVEQTDWESSSQQFLSVEELEAGRSYYVFVTTHNGLYRYAMNDIVKVTGHVAATPVLIFVQKGRGFTNITGEKLAETQALSAVRSAGAARGLDAPFFLLLADEETATYHLCIEADCPGAAAELAVDVDARLKEVNIEYAAKRNSGRLGPVVGIALRPGTGDAYRHHAIVQGQRDTQFKIQYLQYRRDVHFDLWAHAVEQATR